MNACFRHASAAKKILYVPELIWSVQTAVQEFFLSHGPCNEYFRLTADTGRSGVEGGAAASTLFIARYP